MRCSPHRLPGASSRSSPGSGRSLPASTGSRLGSGRRVHRQGERPYGGEYGAGVVHVLEFDGLRKVVHVVLRREAGNVAVAQYRGPRVWRNLVTQGDASQEVGNRHLKIEDVLVDGGKGLH